MFAWQSIKVSNKDLVRTMTFPLQKWYVKIQNKFYDSGQKMI